MGKRTWSDEELTEAVKNSLSVTGVLRTLNIAQSGQSAKLIKRTVDELNLNTDHWVGTGNNGKTRLTNDQIFRKDSQYLGHNQKIRKILVSSGQWLDQCSICKTPPIWNNQALVLTVDHINGISNDHRLENIRLLCPNCHSQTDNFGAKNKARRTLDIDMTFKTNTKEIENVEG